MTYSRTGRSIVTALAPLLLVACSDPPFRARVDDAQGLAEGAPVHVSGARVGEVTAVRVVESGEVEVDFRLERDHRLVLHPDACATVSAEEAPRLEVLPGSAAGALGEGPIPPCPLPTAALGSLGEAIGEGTGRLLEGIVEGAQKVPEVAALLEKIVQDVQDARRQPGSSSASSGSPCEGLGVRLDGVRDVPARPALPQGGREATLVLDNDGPHALRFPALGNARFVDARGAALPPEPGGSWQMSFDVPPGGQVRVSVVFAGEVTPARLDVGPITRVDDPLVTCELRSEPL